MYQELADRACDRINSGIVKRHLRDRAVKAVLDNWAVCDSDWEAEFCRVVESHPRVRAYVKNQGLGLEVPYRSGSEARTYLPDFIVLVDDGCGEDDLLRLVVEIKRFRREDAKEKKATMETYWVPGVNRLGAYGRWAFAEFTDVYTILDDFDATVGSPTQAQFDEMLEAVRPVAWEGAAT